MNTWVGPPFGLHEYGLRLAKGFCRICFGAGKHYIKQSDTTREEGKGGRMIPSPELFRVNSVV